MYIALKILISSLLVAGVSEVARRYTAAAAVLASMPLTTLLAFLWIYYETGDRVRVGELSQSILWLQLPSALFLLLLPMLLKTEMNFYGALMSSLALMLAGYGMFLWLKKTVGA
jgi:hypothetical protein